MPTSLRATASAVFLVLGILLSPTARVAAVAQEPNPELPVSLERIRDGLEKPPSPFFNANVPAERPAATFRTRVDQRVYMLSFDDWLKKEFELTELQRQSAQWAAQCCNGYVLATGAYGIRLDPLFNKIEKALERRKLRKVREQIARELADLEAARKKAGVQGAAVER